MIGKILVAVDASPRAAGVVDAAAEIARALGASMRLVRVVELPPDIPPASATRGDPVPGAIARAVESDLAALAGRVEGARTEPPRVAFGTPWREVLAVAAELDVDLIVVGSHGYAGWDRVLGTTAARIVDRARCAVLVVHDRRREE